MPPQSDDKRQAAREVIDILHEISVLLNTNLDRTELSLCVSLVENGVNPDALATVIKDLRREAAVTSRAHHNDSP
ncbi:mitotic-spindle organizing gamma-tubulin ring associated-domain-containing protein [Aspergillus californicus]